MLGSSRTQSSCSRTFFRLLNVPVSADNSRYQIQLTSSASHLSASTTSSTTTKLIKRKSESSVGKNTGLMGLMYCHCTVSSYIL